MLTFVLPDERHRQNVLAFYAEFEETGGTCIGYTVRPSQQRRGLATEILKEGVALARSSGFKRLLLVCDDDNLASEKVILKNGGQYENTLFDPDEQVFVKRYWIDC